MVSVISPYGPQLVTTTMNIPTDTTNIHKRKFPELSTPANELSIYQRPPRDALEAEFRETLLFVHVMKKLKN